MVRHYLFVEFILKYSCDWLQSFSSKENALMYYGSSAFSVANVPWFRSQVQTIYSQKASLYAHHSLLHSIMQNHLLLIGQLMTFASSCSAVGITLMWYTDLLFFLYQNRLNINIYPHIYTYVDIQYIQVFRTSTVLSWETIHRVCSLSLLFVFIYMLIFHCGGFNKGSEF